MTSVRQLVPTGESEGLIKEVKDQVKELVNEGTIPNSVKNTLVARLVGMACQAYYEVGYPFTLSAEQGC